ncbi:MAG TPA: hypothetical protein VMF66_15175 [Candidatus Acidoferrum sp.]|nr:hypothetical protein [Candidatus Acidoferrum sp.]
MLNVPKTPVLLLLVLVFAVSVRAQGAGYSYVQLTVNGKPAMNFTQDKKHTGWMQVMQVEASLHKAHKHSAAKTSDAWTTVIDTKDDGKTTSSLTKSGQRGPGELSFAAGDDGGLDPIIEARKEKVKIPNATLDLCSEDSNRFVGRFDLKGVRVLSLNDVTASACPMYLVTLSFESIVRSK